MKALCSAAIAACVLSVASITAHAKALCDVHHLGYTKAQCEECTNMEWSVSRVFPAGVCVAGATPAPAPAPAPAPTPAHAPTPAAPAHPSPTTPVVAKAACDIHHLGYTKAQCDACSNMEWSVSKPFPQGVCASTTPPPPIATPPKPSTPPPTASAPACTPTNWGGATVSLAAPNFSLTGVRVTACSKGYVFAKSQFTCSTGVPAMPANAPTTNVTCNKTTGAPIFNPQVVISGKPCCL